MQLVKFLFLHQESGAPSNSSGHCYQAWTLFVARNIGPAVEKGVKRLCLGVLPNTNFPHPGLSTFTVVLQLLAYGFLSTGKWKTVDKPLHQEFKFLGVVRHAAVGNTPEMEQSSEACLNISINLVTVDGEKATLGQPSVFTCLTRLFHSGAASPTSDNVFWQYLPGWFYSTSLAVKMIVEADVTHVHAPSFSDWLHENKEKHIFQGLLGRAARLGGLGRFTCHFFSSPKDDSGRKIYSLVADSCKVIFCLEYTVTSNILN